MLKKFVEQMHEIFLSIFCEPCYIRIECFDDND